MDRVQTLMFPVWALSYTIISLGIGKAAAYIFKLPPWTIPAVAFNNSTSLPLLLLQSLKTSGILSSLVQESQYDEAIERAKSYFLVCAVVSNTLSFGQGGKNLQSFEEDGPDDGEQDDNPDEMTSLLPHGTYQFAQRTKRRIDSFGNRMYESLPKPAQSLVDWISPFFNPALVGAVIGAIIGLTPALQRLLFSQTNEGGYLNAQNAPQTGG